MKSTICSFIVYKKVVPVGKDPSDFLFSETQFPEPTVFQDELGYKRRVE